MRSFIAIVTVFFVSTISISAQPNHSAQLNSSTVFSLRSDLVKNIELNKPLYDVQPQSRKSPAVAVMYSLLLPGMGELYVNGFDQGRYSLVAEGGLWLTYLSFRQYGTWIRDDARQFAGTHASAEIDGKNDQYFVDLGNFNDTYEYNEKKLRDRSQDKLYDVNAGYYWRWVDDAKRQEFRAMRVSSERVFNNSRFVIGAIIVNHIISAVNAARLTRQYNKQLEEGLGSWWLESSVIGQGAKPDGLKLSLVHRF